tara:strand:+ start:422 stop:1183 length:762 start_codon:yes stop_codon:yes gene_type:complete
MKSIVINKANREFLANVISVVAMAPEAKVVSERVRKADDAMFDTFVAPLWAKAKAHLEATDEDLKRWLEFREWEENDLDTSLPDNRYPIFLAKGRYHRGYGKSDAVLDSPVDESLLEVSGLTIEQGSDHEEMCLSVLHKTIFVKKTAEGYRMDGLLHHLRKTDLSEEHRIVYEEKDQADEAVWDCKCNFRKLRAEIEDNIFIAKTSKNVIEQWPEVTPMLEKMYGGGVSATSMETPLASILARHTNLLASPAE